MISLKNECEEDKVLYEKFLDGDNDAFGILMNKHKNNLIYFIFKYVKNEDISEDIYQEVVLYILSKKEVYDFKYSFKTFIYTIAKSRALNYQKKEKKQINYENNFENVVVEENLLEDIVFSKERQEKIKKVISKMNEDYQMVIYLAIIEDLSYKEVAKIMDKSESKIKNLLHRARIKLRKLLIEEKVVEMKENKVVKFLSIIIIIGILSTGIVYASNKILNHLKGKANITPTTTTNLSEIDTNKVWCGTFNLVWNDFMNDVIGGKIEFEDGSSSLVDELNKQSFTEDQLNPNSYYKKQGLATTELKIEIEKGIKEKFNENSKILDKVEWDNPYGYVLYCMLKKEFNYLEKFPTLDDATFKDSQEKVKYFGIEPDTEQRASKNVDILFYNSKTDFAIKLKTKEGEEVYLYRTTGDGKSFDDNYNEMIEKSNNYTGNKTWDENDILMIPFIKVQDEINYDELCGRFIKGTQWYIRQALQTIDFELNNYGGSVKSEALIDALRQSVSNTNREFIFDDDFILYLKEDDKEKPYFALKVDNSDVLVASDKQ